MQQQEGYFQHLSYWHYPDRAFDIYLGNLDTFLAITLFASLPWILCYDVLGSFGSYIPFQFLLLPSARIIAEGASITAVAMVYAGVKPHWKTCFRQARKILFSLWFTQVAKALGGSLLAPLGIWTFSSQLLLLERSGWIRSMTGSTNMVFSYSCWNFVSVFVVSMLVTPLLSVAMRYTCNILVGYPDEDSKPYREQVQDLLLLPLLTCLWTVLYFDIRIKSRGLTRDRLRREIIEATTVDRRQ
jgi:hypothetical protein